MTTSSTSSAARRSSRSPTLSASAGSWMTQTVGPGTAPTGLAPAPAQLGESIADPGDRAARHPSVGPLDDRLQRHVRVQPRRGAPGSTAAPASATTSCARGWRTRRGTPPRSRSTTRASAPRAPARSPAGASARCRGCRLVGSSPYPTPSVGVRPTIGSSVASALANTIGSCSAGSDVHVAIFSAVSTATKDSATSGRAGAGQERGMSSPPGKLLGADVTGMCVCPPRTSG